MPTGLPNRALTSHPTCLYVSSYHGVGFFQQIVAQGVGGSSRQATAGGGGPGAIAGAPGVRRGGGGGDWGRRGGGVAVLRRRLGDGRRLAPLLVVPGPFAHSLSPPLCTPLFPLPLILCRFPLVKGDFSGGGVDFLMALVLMYKCRQKIANPCVTGLFSQPLNRARKFFPLLVDRPRFGLGGRSICVVLAGLSLLPNFAALIQCGLPSCFNHPGSVPLFLNCFNRGG